MKIQNIDSSYLKHYENGLDYFIFQDNPEKAVSEFTQTIKLNPVYSPAYYDLGYSYYLLKDLNNAAKYFKGYLKLNPNAKDHEEVSNLISIIKYMTASPYPMAA